MKLKALKENQAGKKATYQADPAAAIGRLTARGKVDLANLAVLLSAPDFSRPAGLHPMGGGDGSFACPVEIFLAGWVSCAGVTLAAVATSMQLDLQAAEVIASADLDFRGTLAVDRSAPVGLLSLNLQFVLQTAEPEERIAKLLQLTQRYCVVHRTLESPPAIETGWERRPPTA